MTPMRRILILGMVPLLVMVLLLFGPVLPAVGQASVQRVEVLLTIEDILPHRIVQARLQETVESVAERLLLGRALEQLLPVEARLGDTLGSVVDRVATGYVVTASTVQPGIVSTVTVRLRPIGPVIRDVEVNPDFHAIHPKVQPLVTELLDQGARQDVRALFVGLPVTALDWAGSLVGARARTAIEEAVVGYTATVRVQPGALAHVELAIVPRDARVVRNIGVRFRSGSIPIMLLDQHAPQIASIAEPLRGLPVTFAEAHREALERVIEKDLAAYPPVGQYHVLASVALDVAETTYLTVVADSLLYRGRVEAQLNTGLQAPGPEIVAHLGVLVVPRTEAFVEMHMVTNTLSFEWDVGGQLEVAPTTMIGLQYALVARTVTALTRTQVARDVGVRAMWNLSDRTSEGGLSYRFNEFLSGELIGTSRGEFWLRLISNL